MTALCTSREQLRLALPHDRTRAVVMTMGALHAGHAALMRVARSDVGPQGHLTVTVFVNPLQFGPNEDYERYPRSPDSDIALAAEHGADIVFMPNVAEVYGSSSGADPNGVTIDPGSLGDLWEGARRPGHFAGVLTVVMVLLQLTRADVAYFGEKDYQQLTLIRAMSKQLALPVRIVGVPTVRDPDGLALSSRNQYLSDAERDQALAVPQALSAAQRAAQSGADSDVVVHTVAARLRDVGLEPDYIALTGPDLGAAPAMGEARLLVAVRVGRTRLLDNTVITLQGVA